MEKTFRMRISDAYDACKPVEEECILLSKDTLCPLAMNIEVPPEGVKSVRVEDWGVGDLLVVELTNGFTVAIDSLNLGEHQCQVGIYRTDRLEDGDGPIAGVAFDPDKAPKAEVG
jgi:hypothetical protein